VKLFSKQPSEKPLRTLHEREIQERLYGSYRAGTSPSGGSFGHPPDASQVGTSRLAEPRVWLFWLRFVYSWLQGPVTRVLKSFPFGTAGALASLVVLSIISFQIGSKWFGGTRAPSEGVTVHQEAPALSPSVPADLVEDEGVRALSAASTLPPQEGTGAVTLAQDKVPVFVPNLKTYAVQVCTYERERDATRLTKQLAQMKFEAFYLPMRSGRERRSYYVVFLGREGTYASAQSRLKQFTGTEIFGDFSDAFIRVL